MSKILRGAPDGHPNCCTLDCGHRNRAYSDARTRRGFADLLGLPPVSSTTSGPKSSAPASGFSFLGATPAPAPSTTAGLFGIDFSAPTQGATARGGVTLDDALNSVGLSGTQNADLSAARTAASASSRPAAALAPPGTDFASWSASQLKSYLTGLGVSMSGCVEKKDFVALASRVTQERRGGAPPVPAPTVAPATRLAPRSALEVGLPNAFELHGLASEVGAASRAIDEEREMAKRAFAYLHTQPSLSTPSGDAPPSVSSGPVFGDAASFLQAVRNLSIRSIVTPTLPARKLRIPLPRAVLNPVLREVMHTYFAACHTELSASSSAAAAALLAQSTPGTPAGGSAPSSAQLTPLQRSLMPWHAGTAVGPRRYFELPLRSSCSDADVLSAFTVVGTAVALDVVTRTASSLVLQQRVSVPYAAYSAFTGTPTVAGVPGKDGSTRHPVHIFESAAAAAAAWSTGGWLVGALTGTSQQVYTNSITVLLGTNDAHERVVMLLVARYLPEVAAPSGSAPATSATAVSTRILHKDRVGGAVVSLGSGSALPPGSSGVSSLFGGSSKPSTSTMLSDLVTAGGGIVCQIVPYASPAKISYRNAKWTESGAASVAPASLDADIFGGNATNSTAPMNRSLLAGTGLAVVDDVDNVPPMPIDISHDSVAHDRLVALVDDLVERGADLPTTALPGFDDGARVPSDDGLQTWSNLRVAFLDVERPPPAKAAAAPAAAKRATAGSLETDALAATLGVTTASGAPGGAVFEVAHLGDELVALVCELASSVRAKSVLAEAAWLDAIKCARQGVARSRGQDLAGEWGDSGAAASISMLSTAAGFTAAAIPARASGVTAPSTGTNVSSDAFDAFAPRKLVSVDKIFDSLDASTTVAAAAASVVAPQLTPAAAAETTAAAATPSAVQPQASSNARFALHENWAASVKASYRAVAESKLFRAAVLYENRARLEETTVVTVGKALAPTFSSLKQTPQRVMSPAMDSVSLQPGDPHPTDNAEPLIDTSAAHRVVTEAPPSLTPTEAVLHEIYVRAVLYMRYQEWVALVARLRAERDADVEMRARLLRKRAHVVLRCSAAFFAAVAWLSQVHVAALSVSAEDVPHTILTSHCRVRGEGSLLYSSANAAAMMGDFIITLRRAVFHANVLGFRTIRNLPWHSVVAIGRSTGIMGGGSLTITYVDDDKVSAKSKSAANVAKAVTSSAKASADIAKHAAADVDLFGAAGASPPAQPVSVADAFDALCSVEDVPSTSSRSASSAPATTKPVADASTAPVRSAPAVPAALEGLDEEDMMLFLSAGGSVDTLAQLHVAPSTLERDIVLPLLLLLRQLESRPRLRCMAFARRLLDAAARNAKPLIRDDEIPDFWDTPHRPADATQPPLVLKQLRDAGSLAAIGGVLPTESAATVAQRKAVAADFAGLFDVAPAPATTTPAAASAVADAYPDAGAVLFMGEI